VNANAERLRGKFVRHEGRADITIRRDDFVKGSSENPWPEVFPPPQRRFAVRLRRGDYRFRWGIRPKPNAPLRRALVPLAAAIPVGTSGGRH
jgi:hypothetical protein